jgi:hypothetical protein
MPLSIFSVMRSFKKKLNKLDSGLKISFSKIKHDIDVLQRCLEYLEGKLDLAPIKEKPIQKEEVFGERSVNSTERSVNVRRTPTVIGATS